MNKKKKSRKKRKEGFSNTKLFDLLLSVFRENPKKRLNYKQISKALRIKERGVKIQLIDVLKTMAESKLIEEVHRGAYRLIEKTTTVFSVVKNTNKKGAYVGLDGGGEVFIPREYSLFSLAGDEVEVVVFPNIQE